MSEQGQRKKRFVRDLSINIEIQDRDIQICSWVYKYRILNSEQIRVLISGSSQVVLRRLTILFHTGFLDRVRVSDVTQNSPMIYGLGKKGAELLSERRKIVFPKNDMGRKNRELKDRYIQHKMETNELLVAMRVACSTTPGFKFIDGEELVSGRLIKSTSDKQPLRWPVFIAEGVFKQEFDLNLGIIPDAAFALQFEINGKVRTSYFFVEIDRSTMPLKRKSLKMSSFYKKLLGYIASYRFNCFQKEWGFKAVRILTIAKSKERIFNLVNLNRDIHDQHESERSGRGYRIFFFTKSSLVSVKNPEKLLEAIWVDGEGSIAKLVS